MDLDAPVDVTIGPYETYEDGIFGYKAAFESYVTLRDEKETAKLAFFSKHLQDVEDHLPEDPKYLVKKLGAASPIRVVNEVFAAGDGNHGIATAAYNLPNDDRVVQQKEASGSCSGTSSRPSSRRRSCRSRRSCSPRRTRKDLDFDSFFTWISRARADARAGSPSDRSRGTRNEPAARAQGSLRGDRGSEGAT